MQKISCVVLNYNGERLLKPCLDSLVKLDYANLELFFLDNASTDQSVPFVLKHFPQIRLIANAKNSGYAGGANQAIEISNGEFVMILNSDIVFEPDYLKILMQRAGENEKIGAIIGKLRKYDFAAGKKTDLIDSAGLLMYANRRCVDRGQGERDQGQYDKPEEVFGITGACPLYRRKALEDIKVGDEYFDNDFFMYKEDVDISWRMRLRDWKCFYSPAAIAYHGRGTGVLNRSGLLDVAKNRRNLSKFQKSLSYKNERLMRVKNDLAGNVARNFFSILRKEILMGGWMILRERFLLKAFFVFLAQLPNALKKRMQIMRRKKVGWKQMQRWFS